MTEREDGFTLVELILTVAISSVVMGAIAASIVVGLRTTDETQQRLSESHDAQIASAYFVSDVQSADHAALDGLGCVTGAGSTVLISFEWFDGSAVRTATYYTNTTAGEHRLSRRLCVNDTVNGTSSTESDLTIAHQLAAAAPTVTCEPSACSSTGTFKPAKVAIGVTDASGYAFSLKAARRAA